MSSRSIFASVASILLSATSLAAWNNGMGVTGLYRGYEKETFWSDAAGTTVGFTIYTPPEYNPADSKRYPVVYYLHGSGGDELNYGGWFEHDLYDSINLMNLVETGRFPPTIIVMPNGSMGSYTYGSTEAMIIEDLLPYVDANWKTLPMRGARACEGFSKGGYGNSVWIGTHRDLFSSIIPIAGFSTSGINSGNAADIIATVRIRLVKGNLDADRDMTAFKAHLNSLGIPYDEQNIPEAGHDVYAVYQAAGIANMQFNYDTFRYFLDGPSVDAGADQAIQLPDQAVLDGTVTDVAGPSPLIVKWTKFSGPGQVIFDNNSVEDTAATFPQDGTYVLRLEAYDGQLTMYDFTTITVSPENLRPDVSFTSTPSSGSAALAVTFDASATTDPDGTIVSYSWDFGDGSTGTGASPNHTYSQPGLYIATCIAADDAHGKSAVKSTVVVSDTLTSGGLNAEYFKSASALLAMPDLTGATPDITRVESTLNYAPDSYSAFSGLPADYNLWFAARYTGLLRIDTAGQYTIHLDMNDGGLMWLDGKLVVDDGIRHGGLVRHAVTKYLTAGYHRIRIEYFQNAKTLSLRLSYEGPGISRQVVPSTKLYRLTTPAQESPIADISVDCTCGQLPVAVNFYAARSFSPTGSIASYAWDFDGDGVIDDSTANPDNVYTSVGVYPATVTVTDNSGLTNTALVQITVNPGDGRPAAAFTPGVPYGPQLLAVDFDASDSADYDGTIVSYDWDFGDGNLASGVTTSHTFSQKGSYPVTLTVTDNDSMTNAAQKIIEVGLPEVSDIGDLSDDGRVDFVDFAMLADYWNVWEPTVDIVADGLTDPADLAVICQNWMFGVPIPHDEPVAWYTFNNSVLDSSGFDRHGTIYGNPFYAPGYDATVNGALSFDANGDYVNVGNWNPSEGLDTLTVAFWAKWDGPITDADQQMIAKRDSWAQNMMWQIAIKKNVNTLEITQGNGIDGMSIAEFGVTMPTGVWTHLAVTYDGTDAVLYLNGANPISRPFTLGRGTFAPITIGSALQSGAPVGAFQGDLDDVRIYNRPLTQSEVQTLAGIN